MASTQDFQQIQLSPDDLPGAYINIDDFESSIVQLKRWLECRGLKTTGNTPDLETTPPSIVNNVFTWIDSFDMLNMTEGDTIVKRDWWIIEKGVCHRIQITIVLLMANK